MRKLFLAFTTIMALPLVLILASTQPALAVTVQYNNLIDNAIFDNSGSMTASQIDAFLNSFPDSCISSNNGFRAIDPTGYNPSASFIYGGNVTAGRVIYDAARAYDLNPQVLLATLQKEQGLVTGGNGCSTLAYAGAVGYSCPVSDTTYSYSSTNLYTMNGRTVTSVSGTCVNSKQRVGFSQQIIHAAWLLKFTRMRAEGNVDWAIIKTNWDNSDDLGVTYYGRMTQGTHQRCSSCSSAYYDGYASIDGTSIHLDNGATAALYTYTPHKAGNSTFVTIFTNWFGSVRTPSYHATHYSQSAYPTIAPGSSTTAEIRISNSGHSDWYDDTSRSSGPFGVRPVHLATTNPINRTSRFASGWPGSNRPATTFAAVYESNGTTLASNQHIVRPGQIAKFRFSLTVPGTLSPGTYKEYFQPVLEGTPNGTFRGPIMWVTITVPKPYHATFSGGSGYPTRQQDSTASAYLKFKNIGYKTWYDSSSASGAGVKPVVLATTDPINRTSRFNSLFAGPNRPAKTFAAVYESNGTTLASNQHIVRPGQIAKFSFTLAVPQNLAPGTYKETFQPIVEGGSPWSMYKTAWIYITVTPATYAASYHSQAPNPTIAKGSSANGYFRFKNTGNATWYDDTSVAAGVRPVHLATTNPINRTSRFASGWPGPNRPATTFAAVYESNGTTLASNQHIVRPGQIAKFSFSLAVPRTLSPGTYREYFQPVLERGSPWSMGQAAWLYVTVPPAT